MPVAQSQLAGPGVAFQSPSTSGYLLLAAEVDRRFPLLPRSRRKRAVLASAVALAEELRSAPAVREVSVFYARLIAPGQGRRLLRRRSATVRRARFDLVVLTETTDPAAAAALRHHPAQQRLAATVSAAAHRTLEIAAANVRRIGDVDHQRDAVFLFNYFYADDPTALLPVFDRTAGWFVRTTHLSDSTVLAPLDGEPRDHAIINHASWPRFSAFLPSLLLRPSFRREVLATFAAHGIAAQPILYRRAASQLRRA